MTSRLRLASVSLINGDILPGGCDKLAVVIGPLERWLDKGWSLPRVLWATLAGSGTVVTLIGYVRQGAAWWVAGACAVVAAWALSEMGRMRVRHRRQEKGTSLGPITNNLPPTTPPNPVAQPAPPRRSPLPATSLKSALMAQETVGKSLEKRLAAAMIPSFLDVINPPPGEAEVSSWETAVGKTLVDHSDMHRRFFAPLPAIGIADSLDLSRAIFTSPLLRRVRHRLTILQALIEGLD